jgi:EAL domain-containing protein (putative c-di-GMP-specific phosphodiesterase class I)
VAAHHARQLGGNRTVFFEPGQQSALDERLDIMQHLAHALDTRQLRMHIQPQFGRDGQVRGAELLARWRHPTRGDIPPSVFIPIAEEAGLITRLTHWSLEVACETARKLRLLGAHYPLSLNISPKLLTGRCFAGAASRELAKNGIQGRQLIFEITERVLLEDNAEINRCIHDLSNLGIRFSIDDFGTGYSNLALLNRLPLYELKIDQSFVRGIPHNDDDLTITRMILAMAKQLGLEVVAEGVETEAQADFLSRHACSGLQGYLMARPMPIDQWLAAIRDGQTVPGYRRGSS